MEKPKENTYDPQCGEYSQGYSGNLSDADSVDRGYEERDARVDAARREFARTPESKWPW